MFPPLIPLILLLLESRWISFSSSLVVQMFPQHQRDFDLFGGGLVFLLLPFDGRRTPLFLMLVGCALFFFRISLQVPGCHRPHCLLLLLLPLLPLLTLPPPFLCLLPLLLRHPLHLTSLLVLLMPLFARFPTVS